jgi:dihydroorotase
MRQLSLLLALFFSAIVPAAAQGTTYDLILKGGHVLDPKNNVDAVRDVAITGGKIAAIEPSLPASSAKKTIDVTGLYVTPGLVDMHVHVFWGPRENGLANGIVSVQPDASGFRTGVTTMVDAGTAGWREFPEFRQKVIDTAKMRVFAMLNIVGTGMYDEDDQGQQNEHDMNVQKLVAMAQKNSDVIVGIKCAHWQLPNFVCVEKAIEAGNLAKLPVMIDFGWFDNKSYETMVSKLLRPGDISTHVFRAPAPLLDKSGTKPAAYMVEARKRGVIFDVGHGGGSFHYTLAVPMVKAGFYPDSISTDLHLGSINGAMIDILNTMSKFLAMGVPLNEVIRESTTNPATEIHHPELGQIAVGSDADVAVLRLEHGKFGYVDTRGGRIEGNDRLGCEMTVRAGKIVFDFNGRAGVPWEQIKDKYPKR